MEIKNDNCENQYVSEIRVFLSSTFKDMQKERNYLIKNIFPKMRNLCRERDIEFTEIDLRWGLTEEESKQNKVVEICLKEVENCKPFFIGILGERYGWIPERKDIHNLDQLLIKYPFIDELLDKKASVTEMEIMLGVFNNEDIMKHTKFYFMNRNKEKADKESEELYFESDENNKQKLLNLKNKIINSGIDVKKDVLDIVALGKSIEEDLIKIIDEIHYNNTNGKILNSSEKLKMKHEAFGLSRRKSYVENPDTISFIDDYVNNSNNKPLFVYGEAGIGKSSLLSYWSQKYSLNTSDTFIISHYVGASDNSNSSIELIRRILDEIKEKENITDKISADSKNIQDDFINWLYKINSNKCIIIIDAIDKLDDDESLLWLPLIIPEKVKIIISVSSLAKVDLLKKRELNELELLSLERVQSETIINEFLSKYGKKLTDEQIELILKNKNFNNPLFLKTVLEEIRIFGIYENLTEHIKVYANSNNLEELFDKVIERMENDFGKNAVENVLSYIYLSRSGLSEKELLDLTKLTQLEFSTFIIGLEYHLYKINGLLNFANDYFKDAVKKRYINDKTEKLLYEQLLEYFEKQNLYLDSNIANKRKMDEQPWNLYKLKNWEMLMNYITDVSVLKELDIKEKHSELLKYFKHLNYYYNVPEIIYYKLKEYENDYHLADIEVIYFKIGLLLKDSMFNNSSKNYLFRSMEIRKKIYGKESIETAVSYRNLINIFIKDESYDCALKLLLKYDNLIVNLKSYEEDDALYLIEKVGDIFFKQFFEQITLKKYLQLDSGLTKFFEYSSKNKHFEEFFNEIDVEKNLISSFYYYVYEILKNRDGINNLRTLDVLEKLSDTLILEDEKYDEVELMLKQIIDTKEKLFGSYNIKTAESYYKLAEFYDKNTVLKNREKNYLLAREFSLKALNIRLLLLGNDSLEVADSLGQLANIYRMLVVSKKANIAAVSAIQIYNKYNYKNKNIKKLKYIAKTTSGFFSLFNREKKLKLNEDLYSLLNKPTYIGKFNFRNACVQAVVIISIIMSTLSTYKLNNTKFYNLSYSSLYEIFVEGKKQGDQRYYSNRSDDYKLYKFNSISGNNINLNEDRPKEILTWKEWIYYINAKDNKVYRIKGDSSSYERIIDEKTRQIDINEGQIFYTNLLTRDLKVHAAFQGSNTLYKTDLNGNNKIKIIDNVYKFYISNGWIYYIDSINREIFKIKFDGSESTKIVDTYAKNIVVDGNSVYYYPGSDSYGLWKSDINGNNNKVISNYAGLRGMMSEELNLSIMDQYIFFTKGISDKAKEAAANMSGIKNSIDADKLYVIDKKTGEIKVIDVKEINPWIQIK